MERTAGELEPARGTGTSPETPRFETSAVARLGYDAVPFLKKPTWTWEIWAYFFLEGVSSGACLMAALADAVAPGRLGPVRRAGTYVAAAALAPCPPLLIADLGRPERFHHMLRIFKRTSAMSIGSWSLVAYSIPVGLLAARQLADDVLPEGSRLGRLASALPRRLIGAAGIPPALMMLGYPGVLLATTANPLWSRSRLLTVVFAASSIHAGAAATRLALGGGDERSNRALARVEDVTALVEGAALAAWVARLGPHARPLVTGRVGRGFWLGAVGAGLLLPAVASALPRKRRRGLLGTVLKAGLALAGGLALKWAVTQAGKAAAADPALTREASTASRKTSASHHL